MQDGQPLTYFSKKLGLKMQLASTYVRELFALTEAVAKWRQYLLGMQFIIQTDHKILKELLTQVIQTPEQQYFVKKLLGYHFVIEYKAGHSNKATDSLSRLYEDSSLDNSQQLSMATSSMQFDFINVLRQENKLFLIC